MNAQKIKKLSRYLATGIFFSSLSLLAFSSFPVSATQAAETKATEHCSSINGDDELATKRRAACRKGFVAGYDNSTKAEACKNLSGSVLRACESGFTAGRAAKVEQARKDGKDWATEKKSKARCGNRYGNSDNKEKCEEAYDAQIISIAKKKGKEAGEAGDSSPCATVFGGAKAKTACTKAYNDAKSGGSNKCGEVKTYYNFGDVCQGVDKNESDEKNPIIALALGIVNFLAFGVALVVAGGIVYGGILYASARDNTSQTQKGMTVIVDSVIALISFFFLWAIINFIVPGGLF